MWGGDRGVGLVVRAFGGGGGRGGPEFETGKGGRGLAGGRGGGGKRMVRLFGFANFDSVGEPRGETGESGPLAVFALRLEPADEGADKKLGFCGLWRVG